MVTAIIRTRGESVNIYFLGILLLIVYIFGHDVRAILGSLSPSK